MALRRDAKADLLRSVPLFAECSKRELRKLAAIADEIDLREGTVLTREGRTGHEFFVLVEGTVRVTKNGRKLADLGPGDWLGEIALLTRAPRTATATTTSPVAAIVIVDREFRRVVAEIPSIATKMLSCVAGRLARTPSS
jgi:CRP/FNR family transcriptional regulator, cyclic AMP receptor protein